MQTVYQLSVTLHVLAALLWLGGMFFLALVGAPVLRKVDPPDLRAHLFHELGERFRTVGWVAIGILVLTGVVNLHFRGMLSPQVWGDPAFRASSSGHALGWKLFSVVTMLTISGFHDFVLGPAASRLTPGSARALMARRAAAWLARVNAVVGIVVVIAAIHLARGW